MGYPETMAQTRPRMTPEKALRRAIEHIGGPKATAEMLGDLTPQAVSQWERAPIARVLKLEAATDGAVTRYDLRPDIYGEAM